MATTYDLAFCTKYRYDALKNKMVNKARTLLNEVAIKFNATIQGNARVDEDFIQVKVRCDDNTSTFDLVNALKGALSVYLQDEYAEIRALYNRKNCFDKSFFRSDHGASDDELNAWRDEHKKYNNP